MQGDTILAILFSTEMPRTKEMNSKAKQLSHGEEHGRELPTASIGHDYSNKALRTPDAKTMHP